MWERHENRGVEGDDATNRTVTPTSLDDGRKPETKKKRRRRRRDHLHDLVDEGGQVGPLEGPLLADHLVEDAAERPDVRLVPVRLRFTLQPHPQQRLGVVS